MELSKNYYYFTIVIYNEVLSIEKSDSRRKITLQPTDSINYYTKSIKEIKYYI
ncbi:hypothetical protein OTSGILL_0067 [Orientia tsutsugamushi str. Gilliam]|uniref:Uncharacterized protein n=1 Tax=Orientia tsutsugamushi str. Gilliam TaxID=1359184 RepID=A0A0F3MF41_ORITS|nr:hypothetical protein OTSGILL_0067 [Orientia tsutsugamushi str. Gilliam]SPR02152.1 Uncharacterised protein [Orientia tsutsugamushi str. Gilliam]